MNELRQEGSSNFHTDATIMNTNSENTHSSTGSGHCEHLKVVLVKINSGLGADDQAPACVECGHWSAS